MRGLLDTSVVVALGQVTAEQLPDEPLITAMCTARTATMARPNRLAIR